MKETALDILTQNILPFWMEKMPDNERGGFLGRIDGKGRPCPDAPKGAILNARILWAFSASYRVLRTPEYLHWATYAYQYFIDHFIDREYCGVFWSLDCYGNPLDTRKQFYAIGFALYGISEYARALQAAGRPYCTELDQAIALYRCIEDHSRDSVNGGYIEATMRDWSPIEDMRLSSKDINAAKTTNTHLHILEPYTNLYRIWRDASLAKNLADLTDLFEDRIIDPATGHLGLFFTNEWQRVDHQLSFGHEIETYWLWQEATMELNKGGLAGGGRGVTFDRLKIQTMTRLAMQKACMAFYSENHIASEGLPYEIREDGILDTDRHWWVQAEAVVGYMYLAMISHGLSDWDKSYDPQWNGKTAGMQAMQHSKDQLQFICRHLLRKDGEWYWSVKERTTEESKLAQDSNDTQSHKQNPSWQPNTADDLAGFWKCPYHNTRMCLQIIEHSEEMERRLQTSQY